LTFKLTGGAKNGLTPLLAAKRDADAERKLGYLHCTVEAQKAVPTALRPALPQAVARMLKEHGFA
jgi:hypothetical protein